MVRYKQDGWIEEMTRLLPPRHPQHPLFSATMKVNAND